MVEAQAQRQGANKKRIRSGDSSIKRSYNAVKSHFLQRIEAFDKIIASNEKASGAEKDKLVKIKPAFYDLVQEGIGTMIMHLPRELAVQTLGDFSAILSSNLRDNSKNKNGSTDFNTAAAIKVIEELDNVKNHVIEDNHVDEVFVEPLLVAIAEMNGDTTVRDQQPTKDEELEHQEMDKANRAEQQEAAYRQLNEEQDEYTLIKGTNALELSEMNGQVDYLAPLGESHFLVGSTQGQVCIYNNATQALSKQLDTGGLSIYEMAFTAKGKRLAVGCDEGLINIYDLDAHDRVGQVKAQQSDITSLLYVTHDRLVVGQVDGYIDVIKFTGTKAIITHSLQINEAGDINHLSLASKPLELMIACQKGLLLCQINKNETLQIIRPEEEYSNLYVVTMTWCGGDRYIVVTSRPKYKKEKHIPQGEENFAIVTFTLFSCECDDPDSKQILLGQYRTTFEQACFPVTKVQVIVPKNVNGQEIKNANSEVAFKGRFYLTMVDTHLKVIDIQSHCLFDLLSEPNFDQDSVSGMGLVRSLADKSYRLFILCQNEDGNYVQKVDFAATLPKSLAQRVQQQTDEQKNKVDDAFFVE